MFFRGVMTPSLMPAGPDAQHVLDPSSMSVVVIPQSHRCYWCVTSSRVMDEVKCLKVADRPAQPCTKRPPPEHGHGRLSTCTDVPEARREVTKSVGEALTSKSKAEAVAQLVLCKLTGSQVPLKHVVSPGSEESAAHLDSAQLAQLWDVCFAQCLGAT